MSIQPFSSDNGFVTSSNVSATGNVHAGNIATGGNLQVIGGAEFGQNGKAAAFIIALNGAATLRNQLTVAGNINASGNIILSTGAIQAGITVPTDDGINSITLGLTTTMDVYGFPFTGLTRGVLAISGITTTVQANGSWYYQSIGTNAFEIFNDPLCSQPVDSTTWTPYPTGAGDGLVTIQVPATPGNLIVVNNGFVTSFDINGNLDVTGNLNTAGNITGNYIIGDGSQLTNLPAGLPIVNSITSASTITPVGASSQYEVTALAVGATIAAPSGSPVDAQQLVLRIADNGSSQSLTWDPIYRVVGTTLPTTTVAGKDLYVGCIYNTQRTTWDVVAVSQQV